MKKNDYIYPRDYIIDIKNKMENNLRDVDFIGSSVMESEWYEELKIIQQNYF